MNTFSGIVIQGKQRGSALGYPTANIPFTDESVSGVYAAVVRIEKTMYHAAAFADPGRHVLEVHVFGLSEVLYGRQISIDLVHKIRDTARFGDDDALRAAIEKDVLHVKKYFEK